MRGQRLTELSVPEPFLTFLQSSNSFNFQTSLFCLSNQSCMIELNAVVFDSVRIGYRMSTCSSYVLIILQDASSSIIMYTCVSNPQFVCCVIVFMTFQHSSHRVRKKSRLLSLVIVVVGLPCDALTFLHAR